MELCKTNVAMAFFVHNHHHLSNKSERFSVRLWEYSQWSEGGTKPIKQYSKIDTAWDYLMTFGGVMIE